ncbi:MAG: glycosyltransferase family 39 protein [Acidimicrobiales bacterium]
MPAPPRAATSTDADDEALPAPSLEHAPRDRAGWALPAAAGALVAVLAAWGLSRKPFWIDEGITAGATNELWATWKGTGGTMALYYGLLTPWSWASMHRGWLRVPSVLFAVAAVVLLWHVGRRAFDRRIATVAALVAASSWLVVRYAQEARSYSLVAMLTALSWLALVRAVQADDEAERRHWWWAFAIATVLAPLAHGLAVLQFGAQVAWLAAGPDGRTWLRRIRPVFIAVAAVLSVLVIGGANDVASWIPPLNGHQVVDVLAAFTAPSPIPGLVIGLAVLAGVATCVQRRRRATDELQRWMALVPLAWGLLPLAALLVLSILRPYFLARYAMASAPGVALLVAFGILGPGPGLHRARTALVGTAVAASLLAGQVALHRERGDDWTGAAKLVAEHSQVGDEVVFVSPSVRSSFDFAWDELPASERPVVPGAFSPVEPIGQLRRFYLVHDPMLLAHDAAEEGAPRYWVIDEDGEALRPEAQQFIGTPEFDAHYDVVETHHLSGGVRVMLVERR